MNDEKFDLKVQIPGEKLKIECSLLTIEYSIFYIQSSSLKKHK